jgi:ATP-dependent helicase IRC3
MILRPYQAEALHISKERYDTGVGRQLVQLPTGTGKTVLFSKLKEHHKFDQRMLVLVHRDELAQQAKSSIERWNPTLKVGIEMGEYTSGTNDDIVVGGVQTLGTSNATRLSKFDPRDFDALVCDEAHHSIASTYSNVFDHFGLLDSGRNPRDFRRLLLGVTATPNRGDGQGLGQRYDEIIYRMSILDAIRDGWLVDIRGFKVNSATDLSGVHVRAGDFAIGELEEAVNTDARNHLIVQNWLKFGEQRQTVAFCVDIAHAKRLAEVFKAYGVAAEAIWGNDPDRKEKLKWHKAKGLQVLTNCGVLTEGYDDWQISCIIMARPTKSQLLFVQMAGRGTRIPSDIDNLITARELGLTIAKNDCILMDVVDNTGRHSLITLASLFGLGEKTDLNGHTITEAKQKFDALKAARPLLDPNKIEDIDQLDEMSAAVESVNLFDIKWEPEVTANSPLQWHKTLSGDYVCTMPSKETVLIWQDLLDKWNIKGSVMQNRFELTQLNNLEDAFKEADNLITSYGKSWLTLLRREAKWHKAKISFAQKCLIEKLYKYEPNVLTQLSTLSKGEASMLINKKLHKAVNP